MNRFAACGYSISTFSPIPYSAHTPVPQTAAASVAFPSSTHSTVSAPSLLPARCSVYKRHFDWDGDFFMHGNEEREQGAKNFRYGVGEVAKQGAPDEAHFNDTVQEFECDIEGCHQVFTNLSSFDEHYLSVHTFKCEICGLKLPNNRLLEMHIQERHDEFFRVMAQKKKMYQCLVEGCPQKCRTRKTRQMHLVSKHAYPPNYTYDRQVKRVPRGQRARHKDKPVKIDADAMNDSMESVSPVKHNEAANSSMATHAGFTSAAAFGASTPQQIQQQPQQQTPARVPIATKSTILSFMPRSVRTATAPAKVPVPALPPSFTELREPTDSHMRDHNQSMQNSQGNSALMHFHAQLESKEEDPLSPPSATPCSDAIEDAEMESELTAGWSRLKMDKHTLPKKLTFGSMNRRHA